MKSRLIRALARLAMAILCVTLLSCATFPYFLQPESESQNEVQRPRSPQQDFNPNEIPPEPVYQFEQ